MFRTIVWYSSPINKVDSGVATTGCGVDSAPVVVSCAVLVSVGVGVGVVVVVAGVLKTPFYTVYLKDKGPT